MKAIKTYPIFFIALFILFLIYIGDMVYLHGLILATFELVRHHYKEVFYNKYFIAFILGYLLVGGVADILLIKYQLWVWRRSEESDRKINNKTTFDAKKREPFSWLPRRVGIIERFLYTSAIIFNQLALIGIWLALKIIGEWNDKYSRPPQEEVGRVRVNIFLVGNGLSLVFGILGGILFRTFLDPDFLINHIK